MSKFWDRWGSLIQRLVAAIGSWASLVALVFVFAEQPVNFETLRGWPGVIAMLALVSVGVSVWLEIQSDARANRKRKTYALNDAHGIKSYMRGWIGTAGRVAIWTRDLSWADDEKTLSLLKEKATKRELIVCMPISNAVGRELKKLGAEVLIYGGQTFSAPSSRFTVVYSGNGGSQVAIGKADGLLHVVNERDGNDPVLHLAMDLIELARLRSSERAPNG
jgi:hypothetical protein